MARTFDIEYADEILDGGFGDFQEKWVGEEKEIDKENAAKNRSYLEEEGLWNEKIRQTPSIWLRPHSDLKEVHQLLNDFGVRDKKIATQAELLGNDPGTINGHYQNLKELGLSQDQIATQAGLLKQDPETINEHYQNLKELGLSEKKIATRAGLLENDPETIQKKYDHLRGYLSQEEVQKDAELLSLSTETIEGNIQYLSSFGVEYDPEGNNSYISLLYTLPSKKRKKVAWFARGVFDIDSEEIDKKKRYDAVKDFIGDRPSYLTCSISSLRERYESFERLAGDYLEAQGTGDCGAEENDLGEVSDMEAVKGWKSFLAD